MAYQVLARKYRPQTFEQMIGQGHVAQTLANALKSGKIAHAYLFCGPRGVGKTTSARLLAKALNCEKGPTPIPCNTCDACQRIATGQEMVDVLEIDAASNRGIEEIRELRENVRYAPAKSRYKVYIVDEAHQITHDAFNAFLKTLEEPPEHAIFVLATTEYQKIPATILSRCQMFRFKRVSEEEIAAHLTHLLQQEKISAEPEALTRLSRAAGGSVRDSLSLLDQALSFTTGTLTAKQVETLLGFLPEEFLVGFASALLERQPSGVLQWVKQLVEEGWELPQFVKDFREYLRRQVVDQIGSGQKPEAMQLAGRPVRLAQVLHMMKVLGQCVDDMRWNDNPQLVLEMYSLRLCEPFVDAGDLLRKIDQMEKQGTGQQPSSGLRDLGSTISKPAAAPVSAVAASRPTLTPAPKSQSPEPSRSAPAVTSSTAPMTGDPVALWKRFLAEVWKKPSVASHLERAHLKSAQPTEWVIGFSDKFAMDTVQRSLPFIQDTLAALMGVSLRVRFALDEADRREGSTVVTAASTISTPVADEEPVAVPVSEAVLKDPALQKVLGVFKGRVRSVEGE